jgi:hypothetical protein
MNRMRLQHVWLSKQDGWPKSLQSAKVTETFRGGPSSSRSRRGGIARRQDDIAVNSGPKEETRHAASFIPHLDSPLCALLQRLGLIRAGHGTQ